MNNYARIYIILLNWNGLNDTLECIASLQKVDYESFETIVVDNGSTDGSVEEIQSRHPEITLIATGENLGFAEGNNVGIRHAIAQGADYVLLLNNDTVVAPDFLAELLKASKASADRGIFGAMIYFYQEPARIWYAGAELDPYHLQFGHVTVESKGEVYETDYVCGCTLFAKADIFKKIGLLDAKFFLTYEETDFCYRARKEGYKSYCASRAKVWHKISASFGGSSSPLITYFMTRNALLWGERHLKKSVHLTLIYRTLQRLVRLDDRSCDVDSPLEVITASVKLIFRQIRGGAGNAATRSCYMGLRDYILRRFGNCDEQVRTLKSSGLSGK